LHFWLLFGGQWGGQNASKIIKTILKNDVKNKSFTKPLFNGFLLILGCFFHPNRVFFHYFFENVDFLKNSTSLKRKPIF